MCKRAGRYLHWYDERGMGDSSLVTRGAFVKRRSGATSRSLRLTMYGGGLAVGVIFPAVARLLVTPKSTMTGIIFGFACVAAGLFMG